MYEIDSRRLMKKNGARRKIGYNGSPGYARLREHIVPSTVPEDELRAKGMRQRCPFNANFSQGKVGMKGKAQTFSLKKSLRVVNGNEEWTHQRSTVEERGEEEGGREKTPKRGVSKRSDKAAA